MRKTILAAVLLGGMLIGCTNKEQTKTEENMTTLNLTQEWDKVFPLSEKVNHRKVTFETQYGLTLAADLYTPKSENGKMPAIAVSGPFGATKEQSSGLYAMQMAERGFVALAFDPSYTGESSGTPRRTASPDINTEDFMAAVDFLSKQDNVDAEKIGIIGICGWGGIALNAAATDTRIKATVASTMYDMTRVSGNLSQSNAFPTLWLWLAVLLIPYPMMLLSSLRTTTTITRLHAATTSVAETLPTDGTQSAL